LFSFLQPVPLQIERQGCIVIGSGKEPIIIVFLERIVLIILAGRSFIIAAGRFGISKMQLIRNHFRCNPPVAIRVFPVSDLNAADNGDTEPLCKKRLANSACWRQATIGMKSACRSPLAF
jgi:hypothetical protein